MHASCWRWLPVALALGLGSVAPARAEMADVYLKSGLRLRGDVTRDGSDVVVRNAAGQTRFPESEVERIVSLAPASSAPAESQPASGPAGAASRPHSTTLPTATAPATSQSARAELPAAPPISSRDINRLRLAELRQDGEPENVRVRFLKKGKQRELSVELAEQLKHSPGYRPAWEDLLLHGRPAEKLQLIRRETGLAHADRIEIESDPAAFETFRRRVLPIVARGCARSGCHAGRSAHAFRFPLGAADNDEYAYTAFVLLDQLETEHGPMLNRTTPEDSVLLGYLLPREGNLRAHPPVPPGPGYHAVIRNEDDRNYATILEWINSLAMPRPDYGLEYDNPYRGRLPAEHASFEARPHPHPVAPAEAPPAAAPGPAGATRRSD
jgi:hypothetical protein